MGEYLHQQRKLRVNTPLGPDELILTAFRGTDAISTLFTYQLEMLAENKTKVPFESILGEKVTVYLALPDGSETYLNGLCVKLSQGGRNELFTEYEAELVPDVWKLTRKAQSKIYQRMTVPEILKKVFTGYTVEWKLNEKYEPRDYCVQYRETDFNFGARLMEEEGIYFYFEHSDGDHKMIASDSPKDHPDLPGDNKLIFEELEGGERDENRVWGWRKEQEMRPGKYLLWDHCFELPHKHLEAEALTLGSVPVGKETHQLKVSGVDKLEVYDYPGEYAQRFDGINKGGGEQAAELQKIFQDNQRTVGLRMDEETTPAVVIRAKSNVKHLVPGYRFTLQRHFNADGAYVLTGVRHAATCGAGYRSGEEPPLTYENELTCIPAAMPYRPRRVTPKPVVQGSQTAVVVGPKGEEIFTDKYGRVKVQFHWDRDGKNDEESSCWMRVATSWAGRNWGAIRIPRIGHEVIVDFLEGDVDQPIVVGSVYNADMMPPYDLPENKTQSGVKSRSSLGGGPANFNEIRFEDKKGKEEFYQHAERNLTTVVEANESRSVGGSRSTTIQKDETLVIKDGNRTETLEKGNDSLTLKKGNRSATLDEGSDTLTVTKGNITHSAPAGQYHVTSKTVLVEGADKIELKCGGSTITMEPGSIKIKTEKLEAEGTTSALLKGGGSVEVTGGSAKFHGDAKADLDSTGPVTIKGNPVKLNC